MSTRIVPWPTAITPPPPALCQPGSYLGLPPSPPPPPPALCQPGSYLGLPPSPPPPALCQPGSYLGLPPSPPPPALCQPGSYLGLPPSPPPTGPVSTRIVPWPTAVTPPSPRPPALCQPGSYLGLPPSPPPPTQVASASQTGQLQSTKTTFGPLMWWTDPHHSRPTLVNGTWTSVYWGATCDIRIDFARDLGLPPCYQTPPTSGPSESINRASNPAAWVNMCLGTGQYLFSCHHG